MIANKKVTDPAYLRKCLSFKKEFKISLKELFNHSRINGDTNCSHSLRKIGEGQLIITHYYYWAAGYCNLCNFYKNELVN